MLMALVIWILGLFGVAPTDEELAKYIDDYNLRGHHLSVDFDGFRGDMERKPGVGIGWEYYMDRRYHAVSFEVLGQLLGRPFQTDESYWVAGGIGYFPFRSVKIFAQAGPIFQVNSSEVLLHGRVGLGYRFNFFMTSVMPFITVGGTDTGEFVWSLGARLQY
jgi:hypothetical protein